MSFSRMLRDRELGCGLVVDLEFYWSWWVADLSILPTRRFSVFEEFSPVISISFNHVNRDDVGH